MLEDKSKDTIEHYLLIAEHVKASNSNSPLAIVEWVPHLQSLLQTPH